MPATQDLDVVSPLASVQRHRVRSRLDTHDLRPAPIPFSATGDPDLLDTT